MLESRLVVAAEPAESGPPPRRRHSCFRIRSGAWLGFLLLVSCLPFSAGLRPADAGVLQGACLEDLSLGPTNCTANDVTFVLVGLGTQTDGCVESNLGFCTTSGISCTADTDCGPTEFCEFSDEVSIFLKAIVQNTTAQARYDVGMWFSSDGDPSLCSGNVCAQDTSIACVDNTDCPVGRCIGHIRCSEDADCPAGQTCDPPDGARRGDCGREMLHPVGVCESDPTTSCTRDLNCPNWPSDACHTPGLCSVSGGTCAVDANCPVGETCDVALACPPLDLDSGDGAYLTAENGASNSVRDWCGDLLDQQGAGGACDQDGDGLWDDSVMVFDDAQTFPCKDVDNDGFVNIPTCASWGNQPNEVHIGLCVGGGDEGNLCTADNQCGGGGTCTGGVCLGGANNLEICTAQSDCASPGICVGAGETCDSEFEVIAGTPAKCRCEDVNSDIPSADLDLTCSCFPENPELPPGATVTCTLEYDNPVTCTADPTTPERFRCGAASFVRFAADDVDTSTQGDAGGDFSQVSLTDGAVTGYPGSMTWTPDSGSGAGSGIIGAGQTGTLVFDYTIPDGFDGGIEIRTETWWSNDVSFTPEVMQRLNATCPITVSPTWSSIAGFEAYASRYGTVVEWRTDAEVGTAGFELYRLDPRTREFRPVGREGVAGSHRQEGGIYRLYDPAASPGEEVTYRLVEVTTSGSRRSHGPFLVRVGAEHRGSKDELGAETDGYAIPPREMARLRRALRESERAAARSQRGELGIGPSRDASIKVEVAEGGLYRVGAAEMAGLWQTPETRVLRWLQNGRLELTRRGKPVPWTLDPQGTGLLFYGQSPDSDLVPHSVYWLERGRALEPKVVSGQHPIPVSDGRSFMDRVAFEENRFAATVVATQPDSDFWFWESVVAGHPQYGSRTFAFDVPNPAPGGSSASLTLELFGATDDPAPNDHGVQVLLNGQDLGESWWDGIGTHLAEFQVPAGLLMAQGNEVVVTALEVPGVSYSGFYVDSFEVGYPRSYLANGDRLAFRGDGHKVVTVAGFSGKEILVFDVSDRDRPVVVERTTIDTGNGYRVSLVPRSPTAEYVAVVASAVPPAPAAALDGSSNLRLQRQGADYVVVTPSFLRVEAEQLSDLRRAGGLSTMVVDIEDVFDEFRYGERHPQALKDFMAFAWDEWARRPSYLAIIGAGSLDYRDYLGLGGNLAPPWLASTPYGLFASDLAFVDVSGDDGLPELAVGRIPVLTAAELRAYVDKVRTFEGSAGQPWRDRALLLADDDDPAGDFTAQSESVAALLSRRTSAERVYLSELDPVTARGLLFEELRDGVTTVSYLGHGGMDRLAHEGLLVSADVPSLGNEGRTPLLVAPTCVTGRFELPGYGSLAEDLVLAPEAGMVAVWSPSGLSYSVDASLLLRQFVSHTSGHPGARVGDGVVQALRAYAETGYFDYMLRIYILVGDPAILLE